MRYLLHVALTLAIICIVYLKIHIYSLSTFLQKECPTIELNTKFPPVEIEKEPKISRPVPKYGANEELEKIYCPIEKDGHFIGSFASSEGKRKVKSPVLPRLDLPIQLVRTQYPGCWTYTYLSACGECSKPNVPTVVFWGDSHSSAIFESGYYFAQKYKVCALLLAAPGCPPLIGALFKTPPNFRGQEPLCRKQYPLYTNIIAALRPQIKRIIMAVRWEFYFDTHWAVPNEILEKRYLSRKFNDIGWNINDKRRIPLFERAVRNTFATLKKMEIPVTVLGTGPIFDGLKFENNREKSCILLNGTEYSEPISRQQNKVHTELFPQLAEEGYIDEYIDLIPVFCTNATCSPFYQGQCVFFDQDHLNPVGAMIVGCLLEGIFAEIAKNEQLN